MARCRARPNEFEYFPIEDGRILLAGERPRYLARAEFDEAFEVVGDAIQADPPQRAPRRRELKRTPKRATERPARRGGRRAAAVAKRAKPARRSRRAAAPAAEPTAAAAPVDDRKARARVMYERDGQKVAQISAATGVPVGTLYTWARKWKKPHARVGGAASGSSARARPAVAVVAGENGHAHARRADDVPPDAGWMD